jgi:hypothetical protein
MDMAISTMLKIPCIFRLNHELVVGIKEKKGGNGNEKSFDLRG